MKIIKKIHDWWNSQRVPVCPHYAYSSSDPNNSDDFNYKIWIRCNNLNKPSRVFLRERTDTYPYHNKWTEFILKDNR